jgi:tripartite-type tricarboxylate transporter receptor subunit TctC
MVSIFFRQLLLVFMALCAWTAHAQDVWPSRPIKIIVPVAAGGTVDIVARMLAQELSQSLGQSVVVENKPSAASLVGTQLVAKAAPDGYTLLAHSSTFFTAPLVVANAGYDPLRDFAPISLTCKAPMMLVAGPSVQAKTLAELVTQAKAKPGEFSVASSGNGSTGHIASEVFANRAGIKMLNVFYKGNSQSVIDVISGQTQLMYDQIGTAMAHVKAGKLRPLAVTSINRSPLFPEVPTIAELGYPGYEDVTLNMLLAPAGTPRDILVRLQAEVAKAYAKTELLAKFAERGIELVASPTPEAFALMVKSEVDRLRKVAREANIKAE